MRGLLVNPDLCFGCRACSSVCPARRIALWEEDGRRFLRFPGVCQEDCSAARRSARLALSRWRRWPGRRRGWN
ncbi:MAG: hypothetical protein D6793_05685 [Thermoflexia bacterium]|nr:MAG: hypothetical protein D6793_05685 [Thermoflexia bacterium]